MNGTPTKTLMLGLIGDNIVQSKSPLLHRAAGKLAGIDVTYQRLIPADLDMSFDEVFALAQKGGFKGINVTYPYKELVANKVTVADPLVRAIGAVNTVLFDGEAPRGFNTDYTGFIGAYREVRRNDPPGTVCLIGTGGVGKAVAFGLISLNAREIRCVDLDEAKAKALADTLRDLGSDTTISCFNDAAKAVAGTDGIINCTPLGMTGIGGSPIDREQMHGATWVFDAVYTPVETQFLQDAEQAGLCVISGYELFFRQGIDAWKIFSGLDVNSSALRASLKEAGP